MIYKKCKTLFSGIFALGVTLAFCLVFSSCENELVIQGDESGVKFEYNVSSANKIMELFSAFSGSEESYVISEQELSDFFTDAGFENINAKVQDSGTFFVNGRFSQTAQDAFSKSGIVSVKNNNLSFTLNKENILEFYGYLSQNLQSYIDMFMAPSFTGEQMTNDEYLELISQVYGEPFANELKDSVLKLKITSFKKMQKTYSLKIIDILNLQDELIF